MYSEHKLRGIIVCTNDRCKEAHQQIFALLNKKESWPRMCSACFQERELILEHTDFTLGTKIFRSVRVEYIYDSKEKTYRNLVVVSDESLPRNAGIYTLQNPLIKTEKLALRMAEKILGHLQTNTASDNPLIPKEQVIDFDKSKDVVFLACKQLEESFKYSTLSSLSTQTYHR